MNLLSTLQPQSPPQAKARFVRGSAGIRGASGNLPELVAQKYGEGVRYVYNIEDRLEVRAERRARIIAAIRTFTRPVSEEELLALLTIAPGTLKKDLIDMRQNESVRWQWMAGTKESKGHRFRGFWV